MGEAPTPGGTVGTASEHELDRVLDVGAVAFGHREADAVVERWRKTAVLDRIVVSRDETQEVVGSAISLPTNMTVPGGRRLPAAAVVGVAVVPTHRRRGHLRSMMRYQLDDLQARGEPLSTLHASEGSIYGRFGYGPATFGARYRITRRGLRWRAPVGGESGRGSARIVEAMLAKEAFPALMADLVPRRAGEVDALPDEWMDIDGVESEADARQRFFAVYEEDGRIDGAVSYRVGAMENGGEPWPRRAVFLERMLTLTDAAYRALWGFVLGIDLVEEIRTPRLPLDEPLKWMLEDHRQMRVVGYSEKTWLRLVDVGRCLASRRYEDAGSLLLEVEDAFCPWNTGLYRLETDDEAREEGAPALLTAAAVPRKDHCGFDATVERVGEAGGSRPQPDVSLDAESLASVYLGGLSVSTLARAGRIRCRTERSLELAERLFRTGQVPFCSAQF